MTTVPVAQSNRTTGPSLYRLVSGLPKERMLLQPADALVIIGRQLELMVQEDRLPADVIIGTLRFSLFRLHQGRVGQLAPFCRSLTVFGDADIDPPDIPGVTFVPLQSGTPLALEWFLLVDSPDFWGSLLTQAVPDRRTSNMRRYLFEGALTADERVINRSKLLLSLLQRRPANDVYGRDPLANRARWGRIAYALGSHSESTRLSLASCLGEFPELLELLNHRQSIVEQLIPQALQALRRHTAVVGEVFYRYDGNQLFPMVWGSGQQPPTLDLTNNIVGRAVQNGTAILAPISPNDLEHALLPLAQSATAVPLLINGQPWGVLLAGQAEIDPAESTTAIQVIGIAALLEQLIADQLIAQTPAILPDFGFSYSSSKPEPARPRVAPPQPATAPPPVTAPAAVTPLASSLPSTTAAPATNPILPSPAARSGASAPAAGGFGLPAWMRGAVALQSPAPQSPPPEHDTDHSWPAIQKRMLGALVAYDQRSAEKIWSEACSIYPTESICTELLIPVQIAVGEGWHRGEISVAAEHFSSRFVQAKLLALLNAQVETGNGPLAVVGCAQGELHEIGAITLSLFMRWSGFRVVYLGQNVPNSTIEDVIHRLRPNLIALSATTIEGAQHLIETGQIIARIDPPRPVFIFGGLAFYERADLRTRIQGQFLEGDVRQIVRDLAEMLRTS